MTVLVIVLLLFGLGCLFLDADVRRLRRRANEAEYQLNAVVNRLDALEREVYGQGSRGSLEQRVEFLEKWRERRVL